MEKVKANIDTFGEYLFEFTDVGGQRSERKKWMKIVVGMLVYYYIAPFFDLIYHVLSIQTKFRQYYMW